MSDKTHKQIEQLVARLARRIRVQRALEGFVSGAAVAAMLSMIALVLYKTGWIEQSGFIWGAMGSLAIPAALVLAGWLRQLDRISLAQRLDRTHKLHDRLSTALFLSEKGIANEFEKAQVADASNYISGVDPANASPMRRPTDLALFAGLAVALAGLVALRAPTTDAELPKPPVITHERVLDEATVAMERDQLEAIKRELEGVKDPVTLEIVEEIDELLNAVENQEISEREFLERIEELQEKLEKKEQEAEEVERLAQKLQEAAEAMEKELKKELEQEPDARELVDALKKKDLDAASKAMAKIAEKMANKDIDEKQLARLAKVMEKLAKNVDLSNPALEKLMEKNKDLIDKLSKKFDSLSDEDKQRLNRAKEELAKQQQQQAQDDKRESQRKLKELRRVSAKANEEAERVLKGGNKGEKEATEDKEHEFKQNAGRAAKDASEEMKEGGEEQRKQSARNMAKKQLDELREAMQRSTNSRQRQGQQNQDGEGDGDQKGKQMKEFLERAKGETRAQITKVDQGQRGGDQRDAEAVGGDGKINEQTGGTKDEQKQDSNLAGKGEGSRELGEESKLDSKRVDEKVNVDAKGDGPSRSEIIKSASEEGFATTEYKDVYVDYESVVEEVMEKENIPAGYRYYIKRYFQLIKPQE